MSHCKDIVEQQRHPYLGQGGHAGVHDPHPSSYSGSGEILPRYAQKLSNGLLVKTRDLTPPLAKFTMLTLFQNQRVAQELAEGIYVEKDPLAPHPGAHIPSSLLGRPGIGVKLHDYLRVEFSHGCHE